MSDTARDPYRALRKAIAEIDKSSDLNDYDSTVGALIAERDTLARKVAALEAFIESRGKSGFYNALVVKGEYLDDLRAALADTGGDDRGPEVDLRQEWAALTEEQRAKAREGFVETEKEDDET